MGRAEDLLEEMQKNPNGDYDDGDFEQLYLGFGFKKRNGASHTIYTHKKYPFIWATVPRHNFLPVYAKDAVKNITRVRELELKEGNQKDQKGSLHGEERPAASKPEPKPKPKRRKK